MCSSFLQLAPESSDLSHLHTACQLEINSKLLNQVPSLDHFVVQNSGDFLC